MIDRKAPKRDIVAELNLAECPTGEVLAPLSPPSEADAAFFAAWETPLAPWGGFRLPSLLKVVDDDGRRVLQFCESQDWGRERALVAKLPPLRNGRISAAVRCVGETSKPRPDSDDRLEALAGIVFRMETSRWYCQFGVEGRRRLVLYRRRDEEWTELAARDVDLPDGYVTLELELDGDGIVCRCPECEVEFQVTDATYRAGKAGFRSLEESRLASLRISQSPEERELDHRWREAARTAVAPGPDVPDAVEVRRFDIAELGGRPTFADFAEPGRHDMLISGEGGLRAATADGEELWRTDLPVRNVELSSTHGGHGRLIYAFTGERQVERSVNVTGGPMDRIVSDEMVILSGRTGEILARAKLPEARGPLRNFDFSDGTGRMSSDTGTDFIIREWRKDKGGGGVNLWAYDAAMNLLWEYELPGAWYGHHYAVTFFDVDGDGRDELLAGGTLLDADGNVLWVHDRDEEVLAIAGAQHYDAVAIGNFAGVEGEDPVAFLVGGSAGVYVVDALTGRTRARHPIGHAQGRAIGRARTDLPSAQVLAVTRWGNMGIQTLLSGRGERLWTIQPDYVGQGAQFVDWPGADAQLIWTDTSARAQALYDGHGRRVRELTALRNVWGGHMRSEVSPAAVRIGDDGVTYLTLTLDGVMHVFAPAV